ncbi:hypothetical protein K8R33_00555 [archaeon]|nr:hypothetical protein [archaeon]
MILDYINRAIEKKAKLCRKLAGAYQDAIENYRSAFETWKQGSDTIMGEPNGLAIAFSGARAHRICLGWEKKAKHYERLSSSTLAFFQHTSSLERELDRIPPTFGGGGSV